LSHIQDDTSIEHLMKTQCGTLAYLAPEVIKGKNYTEKADIFSLGVVLFVIHTKLMPFEFATGKDWWYSQIKNGTPEMFWMAHAKSGKLVFEDSYKEIVLALLHPDPDQRPSLEQIKQFPWFNEATVEQEKIAKFLKKKQKSATGGSTGKSKKIKKNADESRGFALDEEGLPMTTPTSSCFMHGGSYKVDKDAFSMDEEDDLIAPLYDPNVSCYTKFFSRSTPVKLVEAITTILQSSNVEFEEGEFCYTVNITTMDNKVCKLVIEIFQNNDDRSLRVVQFRRLKGDVIFFCDVFETFASGLRSMIYTPPQPIMEEPDEDELLLSTA